MKLALGTVQFGLNYGVANTTGQVPSQEAARILSLARESGISILDTAIAYGESERVLGRLGVAAFRVVSKLPPMPEPCSDVTGWVHEQVQGSLQRLGTTALEALLLHRPAQLRGSQGKELLAALRKLKAAGLVRKTGVSVYRPEELEPLFALERFDLVQAPLSILDRRLVDSGWAGRLARDGVELHTRSAFLQGLLLMSPAERPATFARWQPVWDSWSRWLQETGLSPLQACLRYPLSRPEVASVVVGVDSAAQLAQIVAAAAGELAGLPEWPAQPDAELINPALWSKP